MGGGQIKIIDHLSPAEAETRAELGNNSDILHRLILGKTKSGEIIKYWSNQDWDGFCRQCGTVLETFQHIFECEVVKNYYNDLSTHLGVNRIYDLKTLFGDHFLWHDGKLRPKILAQFAISSFIIAEISAGRLDFHI